MRIFFHYAEEDDNNVNARRGLGIECENENTRFPPPPNGM